MTRTAADNARRPLAVLAAAVGAVLVLAGCTPTAAPQQPASSRPPLELSIGALLPQTGVLAPFGPAAEAGVALAVADVNDADLGITITSQSRDSGDASTDTGIASVTELLALPVSVVVGALSDGVSKKVVDQVTQAGVLEISPGNTSPDFTKYADNGLYWRTAPSCALEGSAMGAKIADDGVKTLGIIFQDNFCSPGITDALSTAFERGGGDVVASAGFPPTATDLAAQVATVVAAKPDAVVVVSSSSAQLTAPGLVAGGYQGADLYFVGLPITDHSADFPAGSLVGSTASQPGLKLGDLKDFTDRILKVSPALTDFSYAAESYDAVILVALAALAANNTTGEGIASKLQEVSGGSGSGTRATDFASAARIILAGDTVDYDGPSGPVTFDDNGDPADAVIGMYKYHADNTFTRLD